MLVALSTSLASADVFNMPSGLTSLEFVPVGNPGNKASSTGNGAVAKAYAIGKYEVTAGQYTQFLNSKAATDVYGLYSASMSDPATQFVWGCNIQRSGSPGSYSYSVASDWADRPVNYVSFWDACRFVNWLGNGQGDGDTETGAYSLNGYSGVDGRTITTNVGARFWIPTKDEWYKAAYYKGGGSNAGYWQYAAASDNIPSWGLPPGISNSANYKYGDNMVDLVHHTTEVGAYTSSPSPYGTFDQGGNVSEWNATIVADSTSRRGRGGAFDDNFSPLGSYGAGWAGTPNYEYFSIGFRVAGVVPEPCSMVLTVTAAISLLAYIWRPRKRKS
ncbi:MAG: formylglycine-generating enzyme family protein [Planctomycetes bacterium]|nr:formylglycine-generating enzyme family protein [Planctomycetota bacterium]